MDIIVNSDRYDLSSDERVLIPFKAGTHFGFIDRNGSVVVEPLYDIYLGEARSSEDLVSVAKYIPYQYPGSTALYVYPMYGLIDGNGNVVQETEYRSIRVSLGDMTNSLMTLRRMEKGYTVVNRHGETIVPYGTYCYIDGFDNGYAKVSREFFDVKGERTIKHGIINTHGEEVLPCEYDNIWSFYGKDRHDTYVSKKDPTTGITQGFRFLFRSEEITGSQRPVARMTLESVCLEDTKPACNRRDNDDLPF